MEVEIGSWNRRVRCCQRSLKLSPFLCQLLPIGANVLKTFHWNLPNLWLFFYSLSSPSSTIFWSLVRRKFSVSCSLFTTLHYFLPHFRKGLKHSWTGHQDCEWCGPTLLFSSCCCSRLLLRSFCLLLLLRNAWFTLPRGLCTGPSPCLTPSFSRLACLPPGFTEVEGLS